MLKQTSILVILVSLALTSCSTKRFADVVPETQGTPLGSVKIGKENADYFVVPSKQSFEGDPEQSPAQVVVFKTKERHPSYRAAHLAGAPARTVNKVSSTVVGGVTDIAGVLVTKPFLKQEAQPVARLPRSAPSASSMASVREREVVSPAISVGPQSGSYQNPALYRQPVAHSRLHAHNPYRNPLLLLHY